MLRSKWWGASTVPALKDRVRVVIKVPLSISTAFIGLNSFHINLQSEPATYACFVNLSCISRLKLPCPKRVSGYISQRLYKTRQPFYLLVSAIIDITRITGTRTWTRNRWEGTCLGVSDARLHAQHLATQRVTYLFYRLLSVILSSGYLHRTLLCNQGLQPSFDQRWIHNVHPIDV